MKDYCMSCVYFTPITQAVGYCSMLGVAMEKDVVIIDSLLTLYEMGKNENARLYNFVVVQSLFGCICYKRIAMH
jgi:hypothetical protein